MVKRHRRQADGYYHIQGKGKFRNRNIQEKEYSGIGLIRTRSFQETGFSVKLANLGPT